MRPTSAPSANPTDHRPARHLSPEPIGQDWRPWLRRWEAEGQLVRIADPVSREYETSSLVMELDKRRQYPALLFEDVLDSEFPVIANLLATRGRFAAPLGTSEEELVAEYTRRISLRPGVRLLRDPPFSANCLSGRECDLGLLPILTHFPIDAGPYVTAGLVVARDPWTGCETLGFHRMQLKGPDKLGVSLHSRQRLWEYLRRSEAAGRNLEAAVVIGVHPGIALGSMALIPYGEGKYSAIGGLLEAPLEVADCRTIDVSVPAWAEIVVEGEILSGVREPEGPFAEFTNYACFRSTENVFRVKAIQYRQSPLYQAITPGMSSEHVTVVAIQREGDVLAALSRTLPNVKAVHAPHSACGLFHCYVSLGKVAEGQAQQAIFAAFGVDHNLKMVVVVDGDVDVYDEREVWWAVATRLQADRGVTIVPQHLGMGCTLDPSSDELSRTAKMGIDATKPLSGFSPTVAVDEASREAVARFFPALGLGA